MLRFWRNPLLILYVRSDLRPARAVMAAAVTLLVCVLIAMGCWSADDGHAGDFFRHFYDWLVGSQYVLLGVWSAAACGQAVARERELKTFDFLKTTRLTPAEIMVGKVLGAPIVAYFIVGCTLPISLVAGLAGGIPPVTVLGAIVLLLFFNLFYSLAALLASMQVEKSSAGAVGLLGLTANLFFLSFADGPFKGLTTISVIPAVLSLHHVDLDMGRISPTVFGVEVPCAILSIVLYTLLGAWLVLMIVRNLKRDIPQIQLLSRWQCLGLIAFLNLLFYAFLDTQGIMDFTRRYPSPGSYPNHAYEITTFAVAWNALFLFLIGVAALSPPEKLKVWWRKWKAGEASYFSPDGLPWPWLVPAAIIGYAMLAAEALGMRSTVPLGAWRLGFAALVFAAFLAFTVRDILFLQWCLLTRMKHAVMKGMLFLALYYAAAGIVGVVASVIAGPASRKVLTLLMPYTLVGDANLPGIPTGFILAAIALQSGISVLILIAIERRLNRPVHAPVAGAA